MKTSNPDSYSDFLQFDANTSTIPEGQFRSLLVSYVGNSIATVKISYTDNYDQSKTIEVRVDRNASNNDLILISGQKITGILDSTNTKFAAGLVYITLLM